MNATVKALELCRRGTALTTGIAELMVTNHLTRKLCCNITLVNCVGRHAAKAWASSCGVGRMMLVLLKYTISQDFVGRAD